MAVDVERDRRGGVAHPGLDRLDVRTGGDEVAGEEVPEVVEAEVLREAGDLLPGLPPLPLDLGRRADLDQPVDPAAPGFDPHAFMESELGWTTYTPALPGPDLSTLASYWLGLALEPGWVRDSFLAQEPGAAKIQRSPLEEAGRPTASEDVPRLDGAPGRLSEDFLQQVADAYKVAVKLGLSPAKAIAERCDPPAQPRTVQAWVYQARKRGILAPAPTRGRIH